MNTVNKKLEISPVNVWIFSCLISVQNFYVQNVQIKVQNF